MTETYNFWPLFISPFTSASSWEFLFTNQKCFTSKTLAVRWCVRESVYRIMFIETTYLVLKRYFVFDLIRTEIRTVKLKVKEKKITRRIY